MKEIELSRGKVTIVDDEDYEWLSKWKWHCTSHGYVATNEGGRKSHKILYMHRLIIGVVGKFVDHISGDRLDNRKSNLRVVTDSQNTVNSRKKVNCKSRYIGVTKQEQDGTWTARIERQFIGNFKLERHAAMARDIWAKEWYGDYAKLNF